MTTTDGIVPTVVVNEIWAMQYPMGESGESGLPTNVKIAIGVAVPIGVIGIALGIWFFFFRRPKTNDSDIQHPTQPELPSDPIHEMPPNSITSEVIGTPMSFAFPSPNPQELDGSHWIEIKDPAGSPQEINELTADHNESKKTQNVPGSAHSD